MAAVTHRLGTGGLSSHKPRRMLTYCCMLILMISVGFLLPAH